MDSFMNFFLSKRIISVKSRYNNKSAIFNGKLTRGVNRFSGRP